MADAFSWTCPFCDRVATITEANRSVSTHRFHDGNKYGTQMVITETITCPNPDCQEYSLRVSTHGTVWSNKYEYAGDERSAWQLIPAANVRVFPDYVPAPILADYREACLIRDLSPKASATLARRCLQGMIRDFWSTARATLHQEIQAIEDKLDPMTWAAIDAVRKIGNIGAHMEKDINLVVEVDPQEAQLLIGLIETLIQDWYVTRHERAQRLAAIVAVAGAKGDARKALPPSTDAGEATDS